MFDESHGLTPLKKSQYGDLSKYNFYSLRGLVLYLNYHQTLLQGPFIKCPFFCPKSWVRVEKMSMWRLVKIDIFIVYEGLIFN